jgi:hypothetical protein
VELFDKSGEEPMLRDETHVQKRRQFSADELRAYEGKWVAISSDGSQTYQ